MTLSCKPNEKEFNETSKPVITYYGHAYETLWKMVFINSDSLNLSEVKFVQTDSLLFIPNGHYSTHPIYCEVERIADTAFVKSLKLETQIPSMTRFIFINGDSCFYDLGENVYCLSLLEAEKRQKKVIDKHDKILKYIINIPSVKHTIEEITQNRYRFFYSPFQLVFENDKLLYQVSVLEDGTFSVVNHLSIRFDPASEKIFIYDSFEDKWNEIKQ